jgi:hypothetical protein
MGSSRVLALGLACLFLGGCGGDDETVSDDAALVIETVDAASQSFARGEYAETCDHYSAAVQQQLLRQTGASSCPEAWEQIAAGLRETMTPAEIDALTTYGLESVDVDGDTAIGRYGEPPDVIRGHAGVGDGFVLELRRAGDRWVIESLPHPPSQDDRSDER